MDTEAISPPQPEFFADMQALKKLSLEYCDVTPEGIDALQVRLPSVSIQGPSLARLKLSESLMKPVEDQKQQRKSIPQTMEGEPGDAPRPIARPIIPPPPVKP